MHIAKRNGSGRQAGPMRRHADNAWYRLRTRDWDFFVNSDVEAFAVLARHDVEDIELLDVR